MKSKLNTFFVVSALFCLASVCVARPFDEIQDRNQTQHYHKRKHSRGRFKTQFLRKSTTHTKGRKIPSFPSLLNFKNLQEQKRQYIMRPQVSIAGNPMRPYMVIRPPPMTQKTIVTTHIPRPPVTLPYNPYLLMHPFFRGAHIHGLGYGEGLDNMLEGDGDMGKWRSFNLDISNCSE